MTGAFDLLSSMVLGSPEEQQQAKDQGVLGSLGSTFSDLPGQIGRAVGNASFTGALGEGAMFAQNALGQDLTGRSLSGWEKAIPLALMGGLGLAGAMYVGRATGLPGEVPGSLWHMTRPSQWSVDWSSDRGAAGFGGPNIAGQRGLTEFTTPDTELSSLNAPPITEDHIWGTLHSDSTKFLSVPPDPVQGWAHLADTVLGKSSNDFAHTQTQGFLQALGDRYAQLPVHANYAGQYSVPEQLPMSATAYELTRWNSALTRKIGGKPLFQGDTLKRASNLWGKLRDGGELNVDQTRELADTMVQFADGLQWVQHPELALHPLVGIASLNADNGGLQTGLKVLDFDRQGWDRMTPLELNNRVSATLHLNPAALVDHMRANITDFWRDHVKPDAIEKYRNWYPDAKAEIERAATAGNLDPNRLTAIASILSAGENWATNVDKAAVVMKDLEPIATLPAGQRAGVLDALAKKLTTDVGVKVSRDDAMRSLLVYGMDDPGQFFFAGRRTGGTNLADLSVQWEKGGALEDLVHERTRGQDYAALKQPSFWFGIWHSDPADLEDQARAVYEMLRGKLGAPGEQPINSAAEFRSDVRGALPVVVDRQAYKVALGVALNPETFLSGQKGAYDSLAQAYRLAAGEIGTVGGKQLLPEELQAITWMELRRMTNVVKPDLTDYVTGEQRLAPIASWPTNGGTKPLVFNDRIVRMLMDGPPEPVRWRDFVGTGEETVNPDRLNTEVSARKAVKDMAVVQNPDGTYNVTAGPDTPPEAYRGLAPTRYLVNGRQMLLPAGAYLVDSVDREFQRLGGGITRFAGDVEEQLPWKRPGYWMTVAPLQEFRGENGRLVQTADGATKRFLAELNGRGIVPKSTEKMDPMLGRTQDWGDEVRVPTLIEFHSADDLRAAHKFWYEPIDRRGVNAAAVGASGYIRQYADQLGLESRRVPHDVQAIEELGRKISKAYERLPAVANDPATVRAYSALVREVRQQFHYMTNDLGVRVEFVDRPPEGGVYPNHAAMIRDVAENHRLKIDKTGADETHPYLSPSENDMFRAVHDFFGHAALGNDFSRHGEEAAWAKHAMMFSKEAVPAMTTETRGQNSFLNFSEHNAQRRAQGLEAEFPPQKAALLPKRYWERKDLTQGPPDRTMADQIMPENIDPKTGETWVDVPTVFVYVNGPGEAPPGTRRVWETHFKDQAGNYAYHVSENADPARGNSAAVYVGNEFADHLSPSGRLNAGEVKRTFDQGQQGTVFDGQVVVNQVDGLNTSGTGFWGAKLKGRVARQAVLSMPDNQMPQVTYGELKPQNPSDISLERTKAGTTVRLPAPGGKVSVRQQYDVENLLRRVGVTDKLTFRGFKV